MSPSQPAKRAEGRDLDRLSKRMGPRAFGAREVEKLLGLSRPTAVALLT